MAKRYKIVLHWFRRDLRLADNTALHHAVQAAQQVVPLYIISHWQGHHRWTGAPRQEFLCGSLRSLSRNVEAQGGRLIFRRGRAEEELLRLVRETGAEAVFTNRDPDPFGMAMEEKLGKALAQVGVELLTYKDCVLHERDEVLTGGGGPYRVFTPYSRNWLQQTKVAPWPVAKGLAAWGKLESLPPPELSIWGLSACTAVIPEPGEKAARARMKAMLTAVLPHYAETRNTPYGVTTSRLGQDLRYGTLGIRELFQHCCHVRDAGPAGVARSAQIYINELAWREFYMQVLWHWPEVYEQEFDPQWRGLPWSWDVEQYERWRTGQTGFPIVDAGMRELMATGFMHNRVRMITAMFLTKDLRIDWRMGESWFMQALVDGEIASNNGGWQWSAGTGADAAPYFRIQNPWSQTKSYDPEGLYIRQWVPELKGVAAKKLQEPSGRLAAGYPLPMVDHAAERERTLAFFKSHRERMGLTHQRFEK